MLFQAVFVIFEEYSSLKTKYVFHTSAKEKLVENIEKWQSRWIKTYHNHIIKIFDIFTYMEYERSIGLVTGKMKIFDC
jgi:hypothetical protein